MNITSSSDTIIDVFSAQVARFADRPAMRRRDAHSWNDLSWREYGMQVERCAWAFLAQGGKPGDRIGILAHNSPEWLFADIGALSAGMASVPIYPTLIAEQVQHVVAHSEMAVLIVDSVKSRDKVRSIRKNCPQLRTLVVLEGEPGAGEMSWADFCAAGDALKIKMPDAFAQARKSVAADKLATIVYTSGTTGLPKGVMLSHSNLLFEADEVTRFARLEPGYNCLSFLPLSHIAERLQGEMVAIAGAMTINFARSLETMREDLAEVRPQVLTCVPRLWEKMYEAIQATLQKASPRRQALFAWAVKTGAQAWKRRVARQPVGVWLACQALLADRLVAAKLRQRLGLDRALLLISGAAPLAPALQEFFAGLGLYILEAYGQTECTGISHGTISADMMKPHTVGIAIPSTEVRIATDGEILIRGKHVFMGYFKDEAATAATLSDGWLLSGDVGTIDNEGYLRITDRKKDIIVTAGGKNVAPQNIENILKAHAGISQVVVLGDKRKFLIALVTLDPETMQRLLGRPLQQPPAKDSEARALVQKAIDQVNQGLSSYETVKRFDILPHDFTIEGGELTPSLKVKRRVIDERYRDVIDGLYT